MSQRAHRTYERRLGVSAAFSSLKSEFLHATSTARDYSVFCLCQAQAIRDKRRQIHNNELDTIAYGAMTTNHVTECSPHALLRGRP
jgi:hypothetical protein